MSRQHSKGTTNIICKTCQGFVWSSPLRAPVLLQTLKGTCRTWFCHQPLWSICVATTMIPTSAKTAEIAIKINNTLPNKNKNFVVPSHHQQTVTWHVDDLKSSHIDPLENAKFALHLSNLYNREGMKQFIEDLYMTTSVWIPWYGSRFHSRAHWWYCTYIINDQELIKNLWRLPWRNY